MSHTASRQTLPIYEPPVAADAFHPLPEGVDLSRYGSPSGYCLPLYMAEAMLDRAEQEEVAIRLVRAFGRHSDVWQALEFAAFANSFVDEARRRRQEPDPADVQYAFSVLYHGPRQVRALVNALAQCVEHGWVGLSQDRTILWPTSALLDRLQPYRLS